MDRCCYDCPVANCTVRELLHYVSYSSYGCTNGAGAIAVALLSPYIIFGIIIYFIINAMIFYIIYKKRSGNRSVIDGIESLFHCNTCKKNSRSQSDGISDQQNGENNIESNGAEGITYDAVNNEARVTAPEMKRNQAYGRGMTHGQM